jgi:hypothetical protein
MKEVLIAIVIVVLTFLSLQKKDDGPCDNNSNFECTKWSVMK